MAKPPNLQFNPSPFVLTFSLLLIFLPATTPSFTPTDNYLINCGSTSPSITDSYNRKFTGDESSSDSVLLSATRTISLTDSNPSRVSSPIYTSARIFTKPSFYSFRVKQKGAHLVRLHFHRFNSVKFDLSDAQFHVLADGYLLLNNFNGVNMKENVEIKEYILWVDNDKLDVSFVPLEKSKFGFVSAIEVISAPKDLILDIAQFVDSNGVVRINGVSKNGFEIMYRVNVGGPKVTPFNDSLWRTWVPDHEFLKSSGGSKEIRFSGRINYQTGGASREVAPDNVCDSARVISASDSSVAKYNLTWEFPVVDGYKYLVRTHFCDIASPALGSLFFNVYVNGFLAYENLDLSTITNSLASPFYADLIVDGGVKGVLNVTIGPSSVSSPSGVDALLNGIEVFKLNNSVNSFDGMVPASLAMRSCHGGNGSFLVPLAAAIGLLVAASVVLRKRFMSMRDSVPWSRLPVDVSEVDLKSGYR